MLAYSSMDRTEASNSAITDTNKSCTMLRSSSQGQMLANNAKST